MNWLEGLVVLSFLGLVIARVLGGGNQVLDEPELFDHEALSTNESESWVGIYAKGGKVGYSVRRQGLNAEGDRVLRERTLLRMSAFGQEREIRLRMDAVLDSQDLLKHFSAWMGSDPVSVDAVGQRQGDSLHVVVRGGGHVIKELDLPGDVQVPVNLYPKVAKSMPTAGDRIEVPLFDPVTLTQQKSQVEVLGWEAVPELGGSKGYHLRTYILGTQSEIWIDQEGRVLREEGILGMVTLAESRDDALNQGWDKKGLPPDIIALSAVPTSGLKLPSDHASSHLKLKIQGPKVVERLLLDQYPERWDKGTLTLDVVPVPSMKGYVLPASSRRFANYLREEPLLEVGNPAITEVTHQALSGEGEAIVVSRRIVQWVFDRLDKSPVFGLPGALSTLESGKGDCNEHAALFTAMARTAGLPTRVAAGLVWSNGLSRRGAFYYHAWPEVWLGDWVPVDPTFGQFPADASHIRLVVGDLAAQTELVGVIGNVEIEVLEAQ